MKELPCETSFTVNNFVYHHITLFLQKTRAWCAEPFLDVSYKESTEGKTFFFGDSVASNTLYNTSKYYRCQLVNKDVQKR